MHKDTNNTIRITAGTEAQQRGRFYSIVNSILEEIIWFYCDTHLKVLIIQADLKIEGVSQANLTLNIFSSLINLPDFNFYVAATTLSRAILIFPNEVSTIFFSFKQFKCFTLDSFSLTSG